MNIRFAQLISKDDIANYLNEIMDAAHKMLGKTGEHGQNVEVIFRLIITTVPNHTGFLLIGLDEDDKFVGFIFAIYVDTEPQGWVDFIGMWTKPGVGSKVKFEAFKHLEEWSRAMNASRIMVGLVRKPKIFYEMFHKPLGFKPIGLILEYPLDEKGAK